MVKYVFIFLCVINIIYAADPLMLSPTRTTRSSSPTMTAVGTAIPVSIEPNNNTIPSPSTSNASSSSNPTIHLTLYVCPPLEKPIYLVPKNFKISHLKMFVHPHQLKDVIGFVPIYKAKKLFLRPIKRNVKNPPRPVKKSAKKK